jgi:hypothetical protein
MVNKLVYQNWFWYNIIEYHGSWNELLSYRLINNEIKEFIYQFLINTKVIKPIAGRRFIQTNKCDNCGKIGNNFYQLHYKEQEYPVSLLILCHHWKCRYSGLLSYHYDFKEDNKYLCYKKLPLKEQELITRTNGNKTLSYVSPYFLKKMKERWYIFCYWYEERTSYTKYVSIDNFDIINVKQYFLKLIYHNKSFDNENITLLELFEREW